MIIEPSLVRGLIAAQFPQWADLPVEAVEASGTANAIYRLGADKSVRLPRTDGSAADVATEHRWLPRLAPRLPFPVPLPLAQGVPCEAFPRPWSVHTWLEGTNPGPGDASSSSVGDDTVADVLGQSAGSHGRVLVRARRQLCPQSVHQARDGVHLFQMQFGEGRAWGHHRAEEHGRGSAGRRIVIVHEPVQRDRFQRTELVG
ncbi:phosphotransferase [Streptomyces griseus]|uniref:phosphotransferase n=1 Tax=Streptomyces griseus TaxID=1911 RepID=UPI00381683AD